MENKCLLLVWGENNSLCENRGYFKRMSVGFWNIGYREKWWRLSLVNLGFDLDFLILF